MKVDMPQPYGLNTKIIIFFKVNNSYSALLSQSYAAYDLATVHQRVQICFRRRETTLKRGRPATRRRDGVFDLLNSLFMRPPPLSDTLFVEL